VSENRVLRRIFVPKREEGAGGWRKLHNKELHDLYASPDVISVIKSRRMRLEGHVAPEGKRPFGRPRRRWEGNIRMDLGEMVWEPVASGSG
jgi:hypothetical protein